MAVVNNDINQAFGIKSDSIDEDVSIVDLQKLNHSIDQLSQAENIIGNTIISQVNVYTKELDVLMDIMHKRAQNEDYEISDIELEKLIIKLPILIYNLNDILMPVGVKEDLSKIIKQTNYNIAYSQQLGTIADKKAGAELAVKEDYLLETTWKRSVKIISQKIDIAQDLLSACKKLMSKRINEANIIKMATKN